MKRTILSSLSVDATLQLEDKSLDRSLSMKAFLKSLNTTSKITTPCLSQSHWLAVHCFSYSLTPVLLSSSRATLYCDDSASLNNHFLPPPRPLNDSRIFWLWPSSPACAVLLSSPQFSHPLPLLINLTKVSLHLC